jgi:hypothetical protein
MARKFIAKALERAIQVMLAQIAQKYFSFFARNRACSNWMAHARWALTSGG